MEIDCQIKEHFLQRVTCNEEGHKKISLPWTEDKLPLSNAMCLAKKTFTTDMQKLLANKIYAKYEELLTQWLDDKIIEEVPECEMYFFACYLLHQQSIFCF